MRNSKNTALPGLVAAGCLWMMAGAASAGATGPTAAQWQAEGEKAFSRGNFEAAIDDWAKAQKQFELAGQLDLSLKTAANLGAAYQYAGQPAQAESVLLRGLAEGEKAGALPSRISLENNLGSLYVQMRQPEAEAHLKAAQQLARQTGDAGMEARAWNNLGNYYAGQERGTEAANTYGRALALSSKSKDEELTAQIKLNLAGQTLRNDDSATAVDLAKAAETSVQGLPDSFAKVQLLLTLGDLRTQLAAQSARNRQGFLQAAASSETTALKVSDELGDSRSGSLAAGMLGALAEKDGRTAEAVRFTRQARFLAQQTQSPHLLYRWEWQLGRLFKAQGQTSEAIGAFRRAIANYGTLNDCATGLGAAGSTGNFQDMIRPLYYGLADLLLTQAARPGADAQPLLVEARETVEKLKSAELVDYFQDTCVSAGLAKVKEVDTLLTDAAAVYYIPLPDRTEILVAFPSGLERFSAPVGAGVLTAKLRRFRLHLQHSGSGQYLSYSRELYDYLVRPMEPALEAHHVHTIVVVPDGALRTVPLAALNDGEHFLIEKYAVAVTPGLTLMDPRPLQRGNAAVLVAGLSQAVQGHDALGSVHDELDSIEGDFSTKAILNQQFVKPVLNEEIADGNFAIIHIASHGEFTGNSEKSYLLTYDSRLSVNDLEKMIRPRQYRGTPVEMLFLSACQTAAGDDRAALGLAGIAIKSGARSALASLWSVSDEATAKLVAEFYAELKRAPNESKAEALRKAQLVLLTDKRYADPMYWSAFQVIGNWY